MSEPNEKDHPLAIYREAIEAPLRARIAEQHVLLQAAFAVISPEEHRELSAAISDALDESRCPPECKTIADLRAQVERLQADLADAEQARQMHADLNHGAALALGKQREGEGSSWHDIPECITALRAEVADAREADASAAKTITELRAEIERLRSQNHEAAARRDREYAQDASDIARLRACMERGARMMEDPAGSGLGFSPNQQAVVASVRAKLETAEKELREGDYWMARAKDSQANGACPACFASDEEGHRKGCYIQEVLEAAEKRVEEAERAHKMDHDELKRLSLFTLCDRTEPAGPRAEDAQAFAIRFDGPPGPVAGRFVEVEDLQGHGIRRGTWRQDRDDWLLVFESGPSDTSRSEIERLTRERDLACADAYRRLLEVDALRAKLASIEEREAESECSDPPCRMSNSDNADLDLCDRHMTQLAREAPAETPLGEVLDGD